MADVKKSAEALIPKFKLERVLKQGTGTPPRLKTLSENIPDEGGRRSCLLGQIDAENALLILERAPWPTSIDYLASIPSNLLALKNLGANDVYFWFLANNGLTAPLENAELLADLKINLIYPCTEQHIKKYSKQKVRMVTETASIYQDKIRPYMLQKREQGRLNWVWNIIDGKTEVEDVIFRTPQGRDGDEGFLLLPDLNWDRKTTEALHLLGLVERRDIWSLRDLKKKHIPWLRHMRAKFIEATTTTYPELEEDQLKLYVHYQPTYYHFHIHIVHVQLEAGATQATGKAIGLENIMEQLEHMEGDEETGMDKVDLHYTIGEASELWVDIFSPLKLATASRSQGQDR